MKFFAKFIPLIGLNLLLSSSFFAQNSTIDSLNKVLSIAKEDTAKVITLHRLALEHGSSDPTKYKEYSDKSYALALKLNYKRGISMNLHSYANLASRQGDYEKSLSLLAVSMKIAREIKDTAMIANCFNNLGLIDAQQGVHDKAINYYQECLALRRAVNDTIGMANVYINFGNVYKNIGNYDQSLLYYMQALKIYEKLNVRSKIPNNLLNIGNIYALQKDYSMAIDYYLQSLVNNTNKNVIALAYCNMGSAYTQLKMYDRADENLRRALQLSQRENYKKVIAAALGNLGFNYMSAGEFEKALEYHFKSLQLSEELNDKNLISETTNSIALTYLKQKNYKKSLEYGEKGLTIAKQIGAKDNIKNSYESLSETYKKIGNYEKSLEYYILYTALRDSIFSKERTQSIAELQTRYETEKKEKEIQLLTKDQQLKDKNIKEQKIVRSALIVGLALFFILSFTLYNRYRFKQKANMELERQKKVIEHQNFQIVESINYSKQIQASLLPSLSVMQKSIGNLFVFYEPKDIVSGDFYWFKAFEKFSVLACVDCTGHGVPGGFMSTLGSLLLDKIVNKESTTPSEILYNLSTEIIRVLHQEEGGAIQDGMDLSICIIDHTNRIIEFSGARNGIIVVTNGQAKKYKADLYPVGGNYMKKGEPIERQFTSQKITLDKNDWIYMYTDGFMEQIGEDKGLPMNYTQFENHLIAISDNLNNIEKTTLLRSQLNNWRGTHERSDDVLIIGFQVV